MGTVMAPVSKESPLWLAWVTYRESPAYANAANWARHPEHIEGSLWAAFERGFSVGVNKPDEPTNGFAVASCRQCLVAYRVPNGQKIGDKCYVAYLDTAGIARTCGGVIAHD